MITLFLTSLFCRLGLHKWRSIRRTHNNSWSGQICEHCGTSLHTFEKLLGTNNHEKRSLNNFYRVAGGNKPMPYDHEYQHKNHTQ